MGGPSHELLAIDIAVAPVTFLAELEPSAARFWAQVLFIEVCTQACAKSRRNVCSSVRIAFFLPSSSVPVGGAVISHGVGAQRQF